MGILNRALAKPSLLSTSPSSSPSASSASNMALNEYRCPRCPFVAHYQLAWIRHKSVCKKSSAAASSDVGAGKSNEENRVVSCQTISSDRKIRADQSRSDIHLNCFRFSSEA